MCVCCTRAQAQSRVQPLGSAARPAARPARTRGGTGDAPRIPPAWCPHSLPLPPAAGCCRLGARRAVRLPRCFVVRGGAPPPPRDPPGRARGGGGGVRGPAGGDGDGGGKHGGRGVPGEGLAPPLRGEGRGEPRDDGRGGAGRAHDLDELPGGEHLPSEGASTPRPAERWEDDGRAAGSLTPPPRPSRSLGTARARCASGSPPGTTPGSAAAPAAST